MELLTSKFDETVAELDAVLKAKHNNRELKLLNVGSDNRDEYHWRFRNPSGEIVSLSVTREK